MNHKIGIIAEDDTDVAVLRELIYKIAHGKTVVFKKFSAHGCGKLIGRCKPWSVELKNKGCNLLVVVHDLDERQEQQLRQALESALNNSPILKRAIIIPIKEIEAWLLSDHLAIEKAMNLKQSFPKVPNPQTIADPKRYLKEIIFIKSGKNKYYLPRDNEKIARKVDLNNIRKCSSFAPLETFIRKYVI